MSKKFAVTNNPKKINEMLSKISNRSEQTLDRPKI